MRKTWKPSRSVFFNPQACFRAFRMSYHWAAKSSNHSKRICALSQRVSWASLKRLKSQPKINYWAPMSTSKSVFFNPLPLYASGSVEAMVAPIQPFKVGSQHAWERDSKWPYTTFSSLTNSTLCTCEARYHTTVMASSTFKSNKYDCKTSECIVSRGLHRPSQALEKYKSNHNEE